MICQCCSKHKENLYPVRSVVLPDTSLVLCTDCRRSKHEPRYLIIIGGQSGLPIKRHVQQQLYCGGPIMADELY